MSALQITANWAARRSGPPILARNLARQPGSKGFQNAPRDRLFPEPAPWVVVVVEGATLATFVTGIHHHDHRWRFSSISSGSVFSPWALFALATHALPFFVGMTVGIYSFQTGAGPFGAIVVGFVTAGFTLVVGQYAFSVAPAPPPIVRLVIGLLFAVPAARAGYDVTLALAYLSVPRGMGGREVLRRAWRHRCRGHRLGACVDADRHRSQNRGATLSPIQATEWGDDHWRGDYARLFVLSVGMTLISGRRC